MRFQISPAWCEQGLGILRLKESCSRPPRTSWPGNNTLTSGKVITFLLAILLIYKSFLVFLNVSRVGARKSPRARGGRAIFFTSRTLHHLVWRVRPGVHSFDHSFLRSFGASFVEASTSSFLCSFERLFLHLLLCSFRRSFRHSFLCFFIVCLFVCLFVIIIIIIIITLLKCHIY